MSPKTRSKSEEKKLSRKAREIIKRLSRREQLPIASNNQAVGVDITRYSPVIDHPIFQQLRYRRQLANAHIVFPDAEHTRFMHSLDTVRWQIPRSLFWLKYGMITAEDAEHLNVFSLIHDIGHGPYSHVLDRVCSINHDMKGAQRITEMKKVIEACGVSFARVKALFEERDQLYKAVMHHPFGTDKFSYLNLDASHCGRGTPDLGRLPDYIYWLDNQMMVDIECDNDAIDLKWFYIKMYREVYLKKSCLIGQRIIEKEIYHLLQSGALNEDTLWDLTDEGLSACICSCDRGKRGYERYRYRRSKCAVAFKLEGFGWTENVSGKALTVFEKSQPFFELLAEHSSPAELDAKEQELAQELRIDPLDLDFVPPMARYRFAPPPITILNSDSTYLDTDGYPRDAAAIKERASACMAMRVCVSRELREIVHTKADLVNDFFNEWVKQIRKSAKSG